MNSNERDADDWLDAGKHAVMLVTSAIHHPHATFNALNESCELIKGMTPTDMALTMTWLARLASEAMVGEHGNDRPRAVETLREIGLELEAALAGVAAGEDVVD